MQGKFGNAFMGMLHLSGESKGVGLLRDDVSLEI
jgi:hypothetical protein